MINRLPKFVAARWALGLAASLLAPAASLLALAGPLLAPAGPLLAPAAAQSLSASRREIVMPARPGKLDILVKVLAPSARCAVVSDVAGRLAIAHQRGIQPQLSLFSLDDHGQVTPPGMTVTLPCPKPLAHLGNSALALAAHPVRPLLYVWQDTGKGNKEPNGAETPPAPASPIGPAAKDEPAETSEADLSKHKFCHLLIYDVSDRAGEPRLVQATAWGAKFARGLASGGIALNPAVTRLCVPNLRDDPTRVRGTAAIGYIRLGPDGLALLEDDDAVVEMATDEGTIGMRERGVMQRTIRKAGAEPIVTKAPNPATSKVAHGLATFGHHPCGLSYLPLTDHVTIVAGKAGPIVWDDANRRAQFVCVSFYPISGEGTPLRVAGRPDLPTVFFSSIGSSWVYAMDQVDGYLTMLPQRGVLAGAEIASGPVVMARRRQIACCGSRAVHVIGYDEHGFFNGERIDIPVPGRSVEALAYSERFDRLYVAVEKGGP